MRKISPSPGLDPRNVQHVAKRYTDYAIPAQNLVQWIAVKRQVVPVHSMKVYMGVEVDLRSFFVLALDEGNSDSLPSRWSSEQVVSSV
jgi:hypothetical protein